MTYLRMRAAPLQIGWRRVSAAAGKFLRGYWQGVRAEAPTSMQHSDRDRAHSFSAQGRLLRAG